ncbi:MAG: sulfatase-like hydrolase/transferase [Arenicella sp.]
MKKIIGCLILGMLISLAIIFTVEKEISSPNIIVFIVDDLGRHDLSVQIGDVPSDWNKIYRTPSVERLASIGRSFTNAYASSLVCSASRISLMLGQSPARHGTTFIIGSNGEDAEGLKSARQDIQGLVGEKQKRSLPFLLSNNGYKTIMVGKAHFGPADATEVGFDVNRYGNKSGMPIGNGKDRYQQKHDDKEIHLTEALTVAAKEEIDQALSDEKPFFLYMSHYAVHQPIISDARFENDYSSLEQLDDEAKAYATLVAGIDKSLGDLLDHLEAQEIADDTLIFFMSDQGGLTYRDGTSLYNDNKGAKWNQGRTHNWPLRGGKNDIYEGGVRIPYFVAWGNNNLNNSHQKKLPIMPNSIENRSFIHADLLPTIMNILGLKHEIPSVVDGQDFSGYITGDPDFLREDKFFWHAPNFWMGHAAKPESAIKDGDYKLIGRYTKKGVEWELYNVLEDIGEEKNIINEHPKRAIRMAKELIKYLKKEKAHYPILQSTNEEIVPAPPSF